MNVGEKFDLLRIDPKIKGIFPISKLIDTTKGLDPDFDFTIEDFYTALDEKNEELIPKIQIILSGYDSSNISTLEEFSQNTSERRNQVYKLLGIESKYWEYLDILSPLKTRMKNPVMIADDSRPFKPWLKDLNSKFYYWNTYKNYLEEKELSSLDEFTRKRTIDSLDISTDIILDQLYAPHAEDTHQTKGLVIGYVQSGKTSNMQALVSKAIDTGYKFIIVLSGTTNILRFQTQRRFDKQVFGKEIILDINYDDFTPDPSEEYQIDDDYKDGFLTHGAHPEKFDETGLIRITNSIGNGLKGVNKFRNIVDFKTHKGQARFNTLENLNLNNCYFAAIMKKKQSIETLIRQISQSGVDMSEIPTLIIDDESDSASLNTVNTYKFPDKDPTSTNKAIRKLRKVLPRAQYVAYTATPYANVFVNPEEIYYDEEFGEIDDLFPNDFIHLLEEPKGYMGPRDFSLSDYWIREIKSTTLDTTEFQSAMDSFLLSGAIKLYRVDKQGAPKSLIKHHTMLIHHTVEKLKHEEDAIRAQEVWDESDYIAGKGIKRLENLYDSDFYKTSLNMDEKDKFNVNMPKFEDLKDYIYQAIEKIDNNPQQTEYPIVAVVNGEHEDPDFNKGEGIWKVVTGGAKLSRGYTIQGLTVSYFTRAPGAADTLQQMARWFGFRPNYKDLVRLYLPTKDAGRNNDRNIVEEFKGVCDLEIGLRERIALLPESKEHRYLIDGLTPKDFEWIVRDLGELPPTSRSKSWGMEVELDNFAMRYESKQLFPHADTKDNRDNYKLFENFLNKNEFKKVTFGFEEIFDDEKFPKKNLKNQDFLVSEISPKAYKEYLDLYKMQPDRDSWKAHKAYLEKDTKETNINRWLVMIPLSKSKIIGDKSVDKISGYDLSVIKRSRNQYKNWGSVDAPEHRIYAKWIAWGHNKEKDTDFYKSKLVPSSDLKKYTKNNTAVALTYLINTGPTNDNPERFEEINSVVMTLAFPKNDLSPKPVWKPKNPRVIS